MSFTLTEEVLINSAALEGTSQDAVFSSAPSEGSLIVIAYSVNNAGGDYDVALPSGFAAAVPQSDGTFRTIGIGYKVAGASEGTTYTLSMTGSATLTGVGRVFAGSISTIEANTVLHEATDTSSISDSLTAAAGSLVIAHAYSSSSVTKSWNSGWQTQADAWRTSGVWKESSGATETATMTLDSGTNNRLSLALVEFLAGASAVAGLPSYTLQKDGAALGNLTNVKVRVTATSALNGTQYYYSETVSATAGVLPVIDLSATAAAVSDTVTVEILTGANEGACFEDVVEDIS